MPAWAVQNDWHALFASLVDYISSSDKAFSVALDAHFIKALMKFSGRDAADITPDQTYEAQAVEFKEADGTFHVAAVLHHEGHLHIFLMRDRDGVQSVFLISPPVKAVVAAHSRSGTRAADIDDAKSAALLAGEELFWQRELLNGPQPPR